MRVSGIFAPEIQPVRHSAFSQALAEGKEFNLDTKQSFESKLHLILSHCCDLQAKRDRFLLAPIVPADRFPMTGVTEQEKAAFLENLPWLEDQDNDADDRSPDPPVATDRSLKGIFIGYFYLQPVTGVFEEPRIATFFGARGMKIKHLQQVEKIAELTTIQRDRLRSRLALFFGRTPEEDAAELGQGTDPTARSLPAGEQIDGSAARQP